MILPRQKQMFTYAHDNRAGSKLETMLVELLNTGGKIQYLILSVLRILLGFCLYAARQIHMAVFRRFALERYSALFCLYSALFCRILQILGKITMYPANLLQVT